MNNFTYFRKFEHDFWDKTANTYDEGFGHVTCLAIPYIMDHLQLKPAQNLLDVACGPGYITQTAKDVNVTGIDFSGAMIELARTRFHDKRFEIADAEKLPFENETFDHACCNFGMLHFANANKVLREIHRILKPNGRYAFAVWNKLENSPAMNLIMQAVNAHAKPVKLPDSPDFFQFAEQKQTFITLQEAGFKNPRQTIHKINWPIPSAKNYVKYYKDGGARIGAVLRAQNQVTLESIIHDIEIALHVYPNGIVPASIVITSAQK